MQEEPKIDTFYKSVLKDLTDKLKAENNSVKYEIKREAIREVIEVMTEQYLVLSKPS